MDTEEAGGDRRKRNKRMKERFEEDLENEGGYNGVAAEGRIVEVDEDEIEDPDDAPMTMNA